MRERRHRARQPAHAYQRGGTSTAVTGRSLGIPPSALESRTGRSAAPFQYSAWSATAAIRSAAEQ